ncbi:hypothetical protein LU298_08795 [Komagataeibacter intermedius]|uniref:Uncharacterized protein n=1 Tax=Komagataeibacter intermedius NRIC 0521 TaxID=1307934 RepID=A0ABQ0PG19_9PROT|nr:hypothetical protein [Komagataeibacter intermedius]MCF3636598.1 hypothetical protein [Komagataeibacter intermedius]GAN86854.1 hypothetical protein Gain_0038_033 [Komagataeibacter intermedius TF2]GBQ67141.1 hypothetical protein AA0521_0920 [Komagataeibacter intermedius NRIC 0521]
MADQPDSGNPDQPGPFILHRQDLPLTGRKRMLRLGLRVVTIVLVIVAVADLVIQMVNGHGY